MKNETDIKIPYDFDWKAYLELNIDVAKAENFNSEIGAIKHWIKFGHRENRQYKYNDVVIPKDLTIIDEPITNFIPLECIIMKRKSDNPFLSIRKMVLHEYGKMKEYHNYLVILGYNTNCNIAELRIKYPFKKIVIYQLEQLYDNKSNWYNKSVETGEIHNRTKHIIKSLNECDEIWEYDINNLEFLKNEGFKNIIHKPLIYTDILKRTNKNKNPKYDILFYGSINDRRLKYLEILLNKYNICIITDNYTYNNYKKTPFGKILKNSIFGEELYDYIFDSKIIINLHYYESFIQEQVRIFELLINDKLVVSEVSKKNYYGNMIIEFDNEYDILDKIEYALTIWDIHKPSKKFKNLGKIKVGAIYNSFYGFSLLEKSINSIRNVVDYVVLVHQSKGINGEDEPTINKYIINYLLKNKIIDDIIYVEYQKTTKNKRIYILNKRNTGLKKCIDNNCTHILPLDTDELYNSDELYDEIEDMVDNNIDTLYSKIRSYYYNENYYFDDTYYVPTAYKVDERRFEIATTSVLVDPVRKMKEKNFKISDMYMHHHTYLKDSFYEKINNKIGTINNEFIYNSTIKILKHLITWKEGDKGLVLLNNLENNGELMLDEIDIKKNR